MRTSSVYEQCLINKHGSRIVRETVWRTNLHIPKRGQEGAQILRTSLGPNPIFGSGKSIDWMVRFLWYDKNMNDLLQAFALFLGSSIGVVLGVYAAQWVGQKLFSHQD
jgi:hypothetical protein